GAPRRDRPHALGIFHHGRGKSSGASPARCRVTAYVALLRGVNLVGRSTLRMAELKSIAGELGLKSPRTFIASGNLLFTSDEPEAKLQGVLEQRLKEIGRAHV